MSVSSEVDGADKSVWRAVVDPHPLAIAAALQGFVDRAWYSGSFSQPGTSTPMRVLLRALCGRPACRRAAKQRNEIAASQLIELHPSTTSHLPSLGYRIGEDRSGGNGTILQPVFSPMSESDRSRGSTWSRHVRLPPNNKRSMSIPNWLVWMARSWRSRSRPEKSCRAAASRLSQRRMKESRYGKDPIVAGR
jgi:hypothetical protein